MSPDIFYVILNKYITESSQDLVDKRKYLFDLHIQYFVMFYNVNILGKFFIYLYIAIFVQL
jgi:hypothetical protein